MSDVQGNIQITAEFLQRLGLPRSVAVPASVQLNRAFGNGTGDSQVNGVAKFSLNPAAAATVEVDLKNTLADMEGVKADFAEVRGFIVFAPTANGAAVHMKLGAGTPWTTGFLQGTAPEIPIEANGWLAAVAPKAGQWTVAAGSKNVGFENQDGVAAAQVNGIVFGVLS